MLKRGKKVISLLVVAASIISIIPAIASDSSSRLGTKDGTIENAIAYADGKYVYQGYKSNDEDGSIYYNGGDKDKVLDDISDADLNVLYEAKYAFANDSSDQYLIDLTSGDVIDNQTPEDDAANAATKLKSKLKKTDRYGSDIEVDAETNLGYNTDAYNLTGTIPGSKLGDTWYSYAVDASAGKADDNLVASQYLYGFTDNSGNYIDASNLANIYAYSSEKGKMVKINEFSNSVDDVDDDTGLLATLLGQPVALTQDKDYIYALAKVAITDTSDASTFLDPESNVTTAAAADVSAIPDATGSIYADAKTTTRYYIQKISKAQGDQVDDAYIPKTVESYELGDKGWKEFDLGDAGDAYNFISQDAVLGSNLDQSVFYDNGEGVLKPKFTISNGQLTMIRVNTDNIQAVKFTLTKDKCEYLTKSRPGDETGTDNLFDLDDKVDVYMVEDNGDNDKDLDFDKSEDAYGSFDVDASGDVWTVTDGKIYKFTDGSFTEVYNVDSSLDQINVYDKNNLIAWQEDGNIYTTVNEGTAATAADSAAVTPVTTTASIGWIQLADGTWNFNDATGTKIVSKWVNVGGVWYYLKSDGVMATGWIEDGSAWYYLNVSGAMKTGWLNDNGTWYYLNASGAMSANTVVDGYTLNSSGALAN